MYAKKNYVPVAISLLLVSFQATSDEFEERLSGLENQVDNILTKTTGTSFSGYSRFGGGYVKGDEQYIEIGSAGMGVGRLGNEGNGAELEFAKHMSSKEGVNWQVVTMFDFWSDPTEAEFHESGINLQKMYAGATNLFESQPNMQVWAGRNFTSREEQSLNKYRWLYNDGDGAGFKNFDLDKAKLDMSLVFTLDGRNTATFKLHDVDTGIGKFELYANYAWATSNAYNEPDYKFEGRDAYQLATIVGLGKNHHLLFKYANGTDEVVNEFEGDKEVFYGSLEGDIFLSSNSTLSYLGSYKDTSGNDVYLDSSEYSFIARPQYNWDSVHSTWLEVGYAKVDYENNDKEDAWKVTLSQNISLNTNIKQSSQIRFYATVGEKKDTNRETQDTQTIGAIFEAWW